MYELKDTINGWMIDLDIYNQRNNHREWRKQKTDETQRHGFKVYLCIKCKQVYENFYCCSEGNKTAYHEDFPTYKMERRTCQRCEKT